MIQYAENSIFGILKLHSLASTLFKGWKKRGNIRFYSALVLLYFYSISSGDSDVKDTIGRGKLREENNSISPNFISNISNLRSIIRLPSSYCHE